MACPPPCVSTTVTRTTARSKPSKQNHPRSSFGASCGKTPAAQANGAAGWACARKSECSIRPCTNLESRGLSVRLGACSGGKDGLANRVGVIRADGMIERFPTGKVNPLRLEEGEGFITEMGGGGGFGDPLERIAERVLADVRSGYVSLEAARRDYRVVIRRQGRRFELDIDATTALRQGRRQ